MIAGCVSAGVVIILLAILVFVAAVLLCVFLKRTGRIRKGERISSDAVEDEYDEEPESDKNITTHTSDEQERLLRQRTTAQRDAKNRLVLDYLLYIELPLLGGYLRPLRLSPSNDCLILPS